jgi:4-amino-4-deoxy-L-arabinose transferase-like glycosyltransferase
MGDTAGYVGLLLAVGLAIVLARRRRALMLPLVAAALARAAAALVQAYVLTLPDGDSDAVKFERYAAGIAADWTYFPKLLREEGLSNLYSGVGALAYSAFGRSPLLFQSLSVIVGTFVVFLVWKLARELWDDGAALVAAWVAALFPTLVLYSALTLREEYFVACVLLGSIGCARWAKGGRLLDLLGALLALAVGAIFHPATLVLIAAVIVAVIGREVLRLARGGLSRGQSLASGGLAIVGLAALVAAFIANPSIPKIGPVRNVFSVDFYSTLLNSRLGAGIGLGVGAGAYPDWMASSGGWDLLWIVPLRAVYLLFSPFPWDVNRPQHLVGVADSLVFLVLVIFIAINLRAVWTNNAARLLLVFAGLLIVAFAVGTGNFGTAIRHRSTIAPLLIVLAGPALLSLVLSIIRRRRATAAPAD